MPSRRHMAAKPKMTASVAPSGANPVGWAARGAALRCAGDEAKQGQAETMLRDLRSKAESLSVIAERLLNRLA